MTNYYFYENYFYENYFYENRLIRSKGEPVSYRYIKKNPARRNFLSHNEMTCSSSPF